ncbi:MAG TPA: aminoacyl-histidine dipeptidase [Sphingobacterium sp.]|nr:aminoacyl-histidine dipeptidase [Sphingobacterium sp.]
MEIARLEPQEVWENFSALNAIPRASKKEEKAILFLEDFGKKLNLETAVDNVGNIRIRKSASLGREHHKKVVLQAHVDMVHQKNTDTSFNFETQGIQMYIEDGWVKARGTTLGADNGIGVAAMMAVLANDSISHPPLEALFTVDEETGMTGAFELQDDFLEGEILLNLDTEEDDEITMGCAGGVDVTASKNYLTTEVASEGVQIYIRGLQGGHSGMDIDKGRANANVLLSRLLWEGLAHEIQLVEINAGGLRNAIPREAVATVIVDNCTSFVNDAQKVIKDIEREYNYLERKMQVELHATKLKGSAMNKKDSRELIYALKAAPNGIFRMSPDIEELVETSNNIARVSLKEGVLSILCLTRSSVESTKKELADKLQAVFELADMKVELSGDYPGWQPNPRSEIIALLERIYTKKFFNKPKISAGHAGLECGIIGAKYPQMEMVSFGPTIRGAHSPDEKVSISSVQKFWVFLKEILKEIAE